MGVDAMEVIRKRLEDHERRLAILEKIEAKLAKIDGRDVNNNVIKTGNQKRVKIKKSLSDHIIVLRDHGAFTKPFTAEEVHKKSGPIILAILIGLRWNCSGFKKGGSLEKLRN